MTLIVTVGLHMTDDQVTTSVNVERDAHTRLALHQATVQSDNWELVPTTTCTVLTVADR